jgi:hypothetical protein
VKGFFELVSHLKTALNDDDLDCDAGGLTGLYQYFGGNMILWNTGTYL